MISMTKVAALLPFVASALATPLEIRQTSAQCKPNFQGNPVSIILADGQDGTNLLEWAAGNFQGSPVRLASRTIQEGLQSGEFFVEFTGQPTQTYKIKLVADTTRNLVASVSRTTGEFTFSNLIQGDSFQDFNVNCGECTDSSAAIHCQISHPSTGKCVTVDSASGGSLNGSRLVLGSCADAETFHVFPQLSPEDAAAVRLD